MVQLQLRAPNSGHAIANTKDQPKLDAPPRLRKRVRAHWRPLDPSDRARANAEQVPYVYIRHSTHVPLNYNAARKAMPALFDLLHGETGPVVRAVPGHFIFVYIHPYMDGNGRMGRFLLHQMLSSGSYR